MSTATTTAAATRAASPGSGRRRRRGGIGTGVVLLVLIVLAVIYIFPFLVQISTSFKTEGDAANNPMSLIPQTWSSLAYQRLFTNSDFPLWVRNSFIVTLAVTLGRVFFDSLAGYALARLRFRGREVVFYLLIAVMSVPGVVLLIPKFLVINYLGIYDSFAGMILPLLVDAGGVFMMRNFFT
ncbi:MAG TPA: hypothetical protein VFN73_11815, partial [Propionibacteriaceae bacterium]|nr:hypothetical protein [Propionibacteriaceae bacterium]